MIPDELQVLLDGHQLTADTILTHGFVECTTGLHASGGPRNHDLLLFGNNHSGIVVVGIEGKAGERFDRTLNGMLQAKSTVEKEGTGVPKRIDWLLKSLLDCRFDEDTFRRRVKSGPRGTKWDFSDLFYSGHSVKPELAGLRYQLFAGVAATLLEAGDVKASAAAFVVYEFRTVETTDCKLALNDADFRSFSRMFPSLEHVSIEHGKLYGPITLPVLDTSGKKLPHIPLLIGKIRVNLRDAERWNRGHDDYLGV
jgi:hypothetical protein